MKLSVISHLILRKESQDKFMYTADDVREASTQYFNGDSLAADVFLKYALSDSSANFYESTPADMHARLAREFHRIEERYENPIPYDVIYDRLSTWKIVPQGSPMAGIGNDNQIQSISNCFVIEGPEDSYGGILRADQELVQIAKRRGGIGFDISKLRPRGSHTANAAKTTDGIGIFMQRYSNSCREVAQNGRRGALMLTISVHHPEIMTFINIKRNLEKVTGANISIRLSDEFLEAVDTEADYELRFPVDSSDPSISEMVSAKDVWDAIVDSAWASAEPGLLFWDNIIRNSPADSYCSRGFRTIGTNPCSELPQAANDSCRLLLLNVLAYVRNPFTPEAYFDDEEFHADVMIAQKLMDDLVDLELEKIDKILAKIEKDPQDATVKFAEKHLWEKIREKAVNGRRTGLGVTAIGDTVAALNMKYGSAESIIQIESIYKQLALGAYHSSVALARFRGAFPIHDFDLEKDSLFLNRLFDEDELLKEQHGMYGRRNISILTTAPAGSVSCLTQTTSGIEPVYLLEYTRRKKIPNDDGTIKADFVDKSGDRWQEFTVYHHGLLRWMDITGLDDIEQSPYFGATSNDISFRDRVSLQAAAQRWVDHAISSTVNVPNDTTRETIADIYLNAWKMGCKGITVYRDGCRDGVLISKQETHDVCEDFHQHTAPKRPVELPCDIQYTHIKGEKWVILVGLMEGRPYEVMGGKSELVEIPNKYTTGTLIKNPRKSLPARYDLRFGENGDEVVLRDIVRIFDNPNHSALTRLISLNLRHGANIKFVVEQLMKDRDADFHSFSRCVSRVLKKYIVDGEEASDKVCDSCQAEGLVYMEGCVTCLSCGGSKCS